MTHILFTVVLCGFLGGMATENKPGELGRLLTPEDVSEILQGMFSFPATTGSLPPPHLHQPTSPRPPTPTSLESPASFLTRNITTVPVNLKDTDAFHVSLEEYLTSLTQLTDELSRLATNAVTLQDFDLALQIHSFLKDLFAGFLLLNLKNDPLRKRVDGVKYAVKKTEEIVYDLTVRKLVASPGGEVEAEQK